MESARRKSGEATSRKARQPMVDQRGGSTQGFNFSLRIKALCRDVATRVPELAHVRVDQVSFSFVPTRSPVEYGTLATLTPLRFENGQLHGVQHGRRYRIQQVYDQQGREMLYILNFYMPRFMDLSLHQKLVTIFHELLHISPRFDGDLRRFSGRCYMHSASEKEFDAWAERLANAWLSTGPPEQLYAFLKLDFDQLKSAYRQVYGIRTAHPKLIDICDCG